MMNVANDSLFYLLLVVLGPLGGGLVNWLFFKKNIVVGAKIASSLVWTGFISSLMVWGIGLPVSLQSTPSILMPNEISWLMATLILFVSGCVHKFSLSYMSGDRNYRRYFLFLSLITVTTLLLIAVDNMIVLTVLWLLSNLILAFLMIHKSQWKAAKNSGILAIKTFVVGVVFLTIALGILAYHSRTLSLAVMIENGQSLASAARVTALLCIVLAAFSQSGCWPFHRWLMSSLNSPTPVSAFMHAGLVNGGGLLLARFARVFFLEDFVLNILFVLALVTMFLGGVWKLLQPSVKRMLACSTMTQMGFMMMQCALGLFPAALAHLCWHGLFKAFLFLRSGSTVAEHKIKSDERVSSIPIVFLSLICGLLGCTGFIVGSGLPFSVHDTTVVLVVFAWIASAQLANILLRRKQSLLFLLAATLLCLVVGTLYGLTVHLVEISVASLQIFQPQPLNVIHAIGLAVMVAIWLGLNLKPSSRLAGFAWWRRFYVNMLNMSQPDAGAITASKNNYQF